MKERRKFEDRRKVYDLQHPVVLASGERRKGKRRVADRVRYGRRSSDV